jgi:ATP-dependent DNA ligase
LALKGGNPVRLLSRNSKDLAAKFPEIMVSIAELNAQDAVIDGEMSLLMKRRAHHFSCFNPMIWGMSGRHYFSTPSICSN